MKLKGLILSAAIILTTLSSSSFAAQTVDTKTMESNKKVVLEFYDAALNKKDADKASSYLGSNYIQHNPMAHDGAEGLKGFIGFLKATFPDAKIEMKRAFTDGDHVILHSHATMVPGTRGAAVMDIFRLEDGKIVEHWDVVQDIPEKSENKNGML
ncbi:nuclear transport factor 2 family protein [Pseudomonas sp. PLMAX]|uniref:nuclear transport factor 2 family protein n=1 Tax=Pseudomonas sp. PLMAX TaxID=2201998 RepID=UPI0038BA984A